MSFDLTVYLVALGFGATMLGASLLFGDHHGHGHGPGSGHGLSLGPGHGQGDGDAHGEGMAVLFSLRFWTFALAFGGLIGTALTLVTQTNPWLTAILAVVVGAATGVGANWAFRKAFTSSANSTVDPQALVGTAGVLLLGIGDQGVGKVRFELPNRTADFLAISTDGRPLVAGTQVVVIEAGRDGQLTVEQLGLDSEPTPDVPPALAASVNKA